MAAGGGGAWKVAYADFVTAMMAFFMVMWLVGQKEETKHAIAHYFEDPFDDHEAYAAANAHAPAGHHAAPKTHGKEGAVKPRSPTDDPHHPVAKKSRILAIHGGDRAAFGTVITFEGDSVKLDDAGKEQIELAMPKFVGIPHKIEVRGHVSNRSAAKNDPWKLSYERTLAVMAYLVEHGIEPNRIRLAQAGAHEPLTITGSSEAMARNSRVEVFLLEEFAEDTVGTPQERETRTKDDTTSNSDHKSTTRTINPEKIIETRPVSEPKKSPAKDHHAENHHSAPPPAKPKAAH